MCPYCSTFHTFWWHLLYISWGKIVVSSPLRTIRRFCRISFLIGSIIKSKSNILHLHFTFMNQNWFNKNQLEMKLNFNVHLECIKLCINYKKIERKKNIRTIEKNQRNSNIVACWILGNDISIEHKNLISASCETFTHNFQINVNFYRKYNFFALALLFVWTNIFSIFFFLQMILSN